MTIENGRSDLPEDSSGLILRQRAVSGDVVVQLSSRSILHNQDDFVFVFEHYNLKINVSYGVQQ